MLCEYVDYLALKVELSSGQDNACLYDSSRVNFTEFQYLLRDTFHYEHGVVSHSYPAELFCQVTKVTKILDSILHNLHGPVVGYVEHMLQYSCKVSVNGALLADISL